MSIKNTLEIDIIKAPTSKIDTIDFENLAFGNIFTDHMLICDFKEGAWQKPIIKPYEPFLIDPSAKVFHYGQAIFEGMKAYKDVNNDVWLFRPEENFHRFNKSAVRMAMPEVPETIFIDGLKTILTLEKDWVKKRIGKYALYSSFYDCYWVRCYCTTFNTISFHDNIITRKIILFWRS